MSANLCRRLCRVERVEHPRLARDPIDRPKRRGVRGYLAGQRSLLADRGQIRDALAAVGEHHRKITGSPAAGSCPAAAA
jgi:hypothetical protein